MEPRDHIRRDLAVADRTVTTANSRPARYQPAGAAQALSRGLTDTCHRAPADAPARARRQGPSGRSAVRSPRSDARLRGHCTAPRRTRRRGRCAPTRRASIIARASAMVMDYVVAGVMVVPSPCPLSRGMFPNRHAGDGSVPARRFFRGSIAPPFLRIGGDGSFYRRNRHDCRTVQPGRFSFSANGAKEADRINVSNSITGAVLGSGCREARFNA